MERKVILDFIAQNFNDFTNIKFKEMTVFLYGKDYKEENELSIMLPSQLLYAYDVKLPRIFCKKFPLESMFKGLLDFSNSLDGLTVFSKQDFNFDLEEIYSGKNILDLDFNYLYLYPIVKNNLRQGLIVIYAENYIESFKLFNNSVTLLCNGLVNLELNSFTQMLSNVIFDESKLYYLIENDTLDYVYVSRNLNEKLKFDKTINKDNNDIVRFKNHHNVIKQQFKFPYEDYYVYFVEKEKYDDQTSNYLHISSLSKVNLPVEFSLIVVDWVLKNTEFKDYVDSLNLTDKYYICACEDNYYLLLIEKKMKKVEIRQMLKGIGCFYISIFAPTEINNKMDFSKLIKYFKNVRPDEFLYHEYLTYINSISSEYLVVNKNKYIKRIVYNSINQDTTFEMINYVTDGFKYLDAVSEFEKQAILKLNNYIKENKTSVFVCLQSSSLLKRKLVEIYKKFENKGVKLNVIVHYDDLTSKQDLFNALSYMKLHEVECFADSSIFLNLNIIDTLSLFDGCYVKKDEFAGLMKTSNKLANMFITYFYNDGKKVIFEKSQNEEYNHRYQNELIYFVKESGEKSNGTKRK